jgi:hypothetical protein
MKKVLVAISVIVVAVLLMCTAASQATATPPVKFKLLNPPPKNKPLELAAGETCTFDILVTSNEPFVLAIAMTDQYYPGRGVFWHGSDRATQGTEAVLHLTMTGKKSTADLAAVCDWPEPGYCWPEGVAPVAIVVGVRYEGGITFSERFPFAVEVP